MGAYHIEDINVIPYFDMEMIMNTSQETRIGGDSLRRLAAQWEVWLPALRAKKISAGKKGYLAVWLEQSVEQDVDEVWKKSPSEGYLFNALAQSMCMGALNEILPEIETAGCAPAPKPDGELSEALSSAGLSYADDGPALVRRYGVVTYNPFKGACDICFLRDSCPKAQGGGQGALSVVLPGHETGRD